jgi:hypothetical protein
LLFDGVENTDKLVEGYFLGFGVAKDLIITKPNRKSKHPSKR